MASKRWMKTETLLPNKSQWYPVLGLGIAVLCHKDKEVTIFDK